MSRNLGRQRRVQRGVHLVAGAVLLATAYAPITSSWRDVIRWVILPILVVTGLWMWNAARIRRFIDGRVSGRPVGSGTASIP